MSDLSGEFNDLSFTDRRRRGSEPPVDYDVEAQGPLPSSSYTQRASFFGNPLDPIQEGVMYDSPPSPTGSNDSTSSVSLYDVPGADVVAQAEDGSLLAKFGKRTFYWLQSAGMVTSLAGAAMQGAYPATASAASYVQGAGGVMTVVGGLYNTFEDARKAMERGHIDPQTGLSAPKVHPLTKAGSKPAVQLAANLFTASGGLVSAGAALAAGRTDIAFAGTVISAAAAALNTINAGREDPGKTGNHFLIQHREEILSMDSWTAMPRDVQKALRKFYQNHDKRVARATAAAVQSQGSVKRPSVGRSSSVSHPSGGGYGYQQNPQAAWGPGAGPGQGSGSQQRKGRK